MSTYSYPRLFGIHILFNDGSKAYDRIDMTTEEFGKELLKWCANYNLEFYSFFGKNVLSFIATKK